MLYWASSRNQQVHMFFHHFLINQTKLRTLNKQEINQHRKQDHVECKNWQRTNQDENRKRLKICTSTFSEWNHQMWAEKEEREFHFHFFQMGFTSFLSLSWLLEKMSNWALKKEEQIIITAKMLKRRFCPFVFCSLWPPEV